MPVTMKHKFLFLEGCKNHFIIQGVLIHLQQLVSYELNLSFTVWNLTHPVMNMCEKVVDTWYYFNIMMSINRSINHMLHSQTCHKYSVSFKLQLFQTSSILQYLFKANQDVYTLKLIPLLYCSIKLLEFKICPQLYSPSNLDVKLRAQDSVHFKRSFLFSIVYLIPN